MSENEVLEKIAAQFASDAGVNVAKWFGKPCVRVGKKVFIVQWGSNLAFKLGGEAIDEALKMPGAHLFDPRGQGHPMKEWVQIPLAQASAWDKFSEMAYTNALIAEE